MITSNVSYAIYLLILKPTACTCVLKLSLLIMINLRKNINYFDRCKKSAQTRQILKFDEHRILQKLRFHDTMSFL